MNKIEVLTNKITQAIINADGYKINENINWYDQIDDQILKIKQVYDDVKESESSVRKRLEVGQKRLSGLQNEVQALEKNVRSVKDEYERQQKELSLARKECDRLFKKCNKAKKSMDITSQEKQRLEITKFEFDMYARLTNIKWDFTNQDTKSVRGYLRNKPAAKVKTFSYNCNQLTHDQIVMNLWNDIDTIEDDWLEVSDKENIDNQTIRV